VCREEIPYTLTIKADISQDYEILAYCNGKLFDSEVIRAEGGEETIYDSDFVLPEYGYVDFKLSVKRGDGSISNEYSKSIYSLPPVRESVFLPYTRRLGLAGALEVSQGNDVAQFNSHRLEFDWQKSETSKGVYKIGHDSNIAEAIELDSDIVALINQNNSLYGDTKIHSGGQLEIPHSKSSLDGYCGFVTAIQKKYAENSPIEYFEIYNEPNCYYFAGKDESYTYMAQLARLSLKKNNPDDKTAIGTIAEGDASYLERLMKTGIYQHMDAVSNHPYIRPDLVDERYSEELSEMTGVITKYGGWKEQIITEIGWPTHTLGISKEQQAIELVKQAIVADYFDIGINQYYKSSDEITLSGYSEAESEHNFGIFYQKDGTLKPAAYSISAMNYETAGAVFCGKLPFKNEDIEAYLYARDGEIICIAWTKKGESGTITFNGDDLKAYDMNGNFINSGNEFAISEDPVYIHGVPKECIANALSQNIQDYLDLYIPLSFSQSEGKTGFDEAKDFLYNTVINAEAFAEEYDGNEETTLEYLYEHYNAGKSVIEMYKNGELDISQSQLSGLLYLNHWGGMLWSSLYMIDADSGDFTLNGEAAYAEAKEVIDGIKGENTLKYSDAILLYAKKYSDKAKGLNSVNAGADFKVGAEKAWDKMAEILSEVACNMAEIETVGYDNVLIQLPYDQRTIATGETVILNISVYNFRPSTRLSGYAELLASDGSVVATSLNFGVSAGKSTVAKMPVNLSKIKSGTYTLRLISSTGDELTRHNITF